jgi:serine/threonine protein kinase
MTSEQRAEAPNRVGEIIGRKYEIYGVLGRGGFGVVYLVYAHGSDSVFALKTPRDKYLDDEATLDRFRIEANAWVNLERHPYLVQAHLVEEFSGRLYIVMEYIAPGEMGLNSLKGYLKHRPPDLEQSLRWGVQFCYGMEYARSRGIRCHRDIKPANIMIGQNQEVKITDFGLAAVLDQVSTKLAAGSPPYMPPEQFTNSADCDERSDIYAFGIVLFQMASGGKLPFMASRPRDSSKEETARFVVEMQSMHSRAPVPKLDSPLFPIIRRCMEKKPGDRYQSFKALRSDLERVFKQETGQVVKLPESKDLSISEWNNKGVSLNSLGRFEEAIYAFNTVLEMDPLDVSAWNNKGTSLNGLGSFEEAIQCYDKALTIDPRNAYAWNNKGMSYNGLERFGEAVDCFDVALEIHPQYAEAWTNKGISFNRMGEPREAIRCHNKALRFDPQLATTWFNLADSFQLLDSFEEAVSCYEKALELEPNRPQVWFKKAQLEESLGWKRRAARSYKEFISLAPEQLTEQVMQACIWLVKADVDPDHPGVYDRLQEAGVQGTGVQGASPQEADEDSQKSPEP